MRRYSPQNDALLDHDGGLGENLFIHYARSFGEFLAKINHFGGLYPPKDLLFGQEYAEPNAT
jgi:hypothetical protein